MKTYEIRIIGLTQEQCKAVLEDALLGIVDHAQVYRDGKRVAWGIEPQGEEQAA